MKLYHALLAGLVACGLVFAQEAATTTAAPAAEKAAPEKKAKKPSIASVIGTVVSVDAIGNTIIIKTKKAEDTLTVNEKTTILVGGATVALADLKADTRVKADYKMEEGKKVAIKIAEKSAGIKSKKAEGAAPAATPEAK